MKKFNHAYDIAFEVISNREDGSDVTPEMFREGLLRRIAQLDADNEWHEAHSSKPFDTYEMDEDEDAARPPPSQAPWE